MLSHRNFTQLLFVILLTCFAIETKGDQTSFTDSEKSTIDKLRPLIANYLVPDYMKSDVYYLRLLKAAKFDVKNAVRIVKLNTKWRKQNNVDEILNEDLNKYVLDFPVKLEGVDKEGSPVIQFYLGKWKLRKYALSNNPELRNVPLKMFIQSIEAAEQKLFEIQKSGGQNISSAYFLDDVDGYTIRENTCSKCLYLMADIIRAFTHYPSMMKRSIVINAPKRFSRVIQLVNEILPSEVTQINSVYAPQDNTWRDVVLKDISANQLPLDFGGTRRNWYNKY